jgi:hypothetical protein
VYTLQLQRVTLSHKEQYHIQPVCVHWQIYSYAMQPTQ